MQTLLTAQEIYTPFRRYAPGAVLVEGSRILAAGNLVDMLSLASGEQSIDLGAARLVPGLIDLHIHGMGGHDVFPAGLPHVCSDLPRHGVTGFLVTTYPINPADFLDELDLIASIIQNPPAGAQPLGVHLEGPFLSPRRPGMADRNLFEPLTGPALERLLVAARGTVRMITFAPEQPGALDLIPWLLEKNIVASLGHTEADFETVRRAVALGLRHATHTFNAMNGLHHREPGTVGAVLYFDEITAQLVGDGEHVHPAVMRVLVRAKGAERVCLVSDAQPFATLPSGVYQWGPYELHIDEHISRLPDGTIASSVQLMNTMLRVLVEEAGLSFSDALITATDVPARVLGLPKGRLEAGYDADLTALDDNYRPVLTMVGGQVVYRTNKESNLP